MVIGIALGSTLKQNSAGICIFNHLQSRTTPGSSSRKLSQVAEFDMLSYSTCSKAVDQDRRETTLREPPDLMYSIWCSFGLHPFMCDVWHSPYLPQWVDLNSVIAPIINVSNLHFTGFFIEGDDLSSPPSSFHCWSCTDHTNWTQTRIEELFKPKIAVQQMVTSRQSRHFQNYISIKTYIIIYKSWWQQWVLPPALNHTVVFSIVYSFCLHLV